MNRFNAIFNVWARPFTAVALVATIAIILGYPSLRAWATTANLSGTPPTPHVIVTPTQNEQRPRIDVVFALDTTGSMGGLIAAAKAKIWSIASTMAAGQPAPDIRVGLVAYRDRGDAYVTQRLDLTGDLDAMYAQLMQYEASGGGDTPESVNKALEDAIEQMAWDHDPKTYRAIFLVGDAPAHMDYPNERQYPELIALASKRDIIVNTVQCGAHGQTRVQWETIAALAQGEAFQVDQDGSAVAVATPFDDRIAGLAKELDETRLYFGSADERKARSDKAEQTAARMTAAPVAVQAARGIFNASKSGERSLAEDQELLEGVASGAVDLDSIAPADLPAPLAQVAPEERAAVTGALIQRRNELKSSLQGLSRQRNDYIAREAPEAELGESLDHRLFDALKKQTKDKGLTYDDDALTY